MTVFLDTTALVSRYLEGPNREIVLGAMGGDSDWCASALALMEAEMLVERLEGDGERRDRLRSAILEDWDRIHVVPVDTLCLSVAAEIGRAQPVRSTDAIHLAAADRLPRPVRFATFDPNQIGPALALGFEIVSALTA